jgi:benzoate-CoA ligase family protein
MIRHKDIPRSFNVTTWFLDRNLEEGKGERVALYCGADAVTYDELARLANRVGNVLLELGVRPEDRVLLALSDGKEFVATWYAALKIGAVVAEAYTFLQVKDYAYYADYTRARVVVVDETTLAKVEQAVAGTRFPPRLLAVGGSFDELVAQAPEELEPAATTKDDLAIWKFTTGSTGAPKAAVHRAHDPLVSFECYARGVVGYREDDVVLPVPKLFFGYARDATTLFTFGVGAAGIVFPERSTPERLFELIERHRPTIMVQVPTMMTAMLEHPGAGDRDLSSLRLCISSGEALPSQIHRRWLDVYGVEVLEGVGSSELYHIYLSNRPGRVRPGSAGEVVPGYEARLLDEDGQPTPAGVPGELWASGESTALCYWGDHEKSKHTFHGDTVRTGDLFDRDGDGYFWYRGRADDLLKVGGIWVAPLEIENCLLRHPAVVECAVVGYEEQGLTLPRAYVVLRAGTESDELASELREFVRADLSPHKYPREVRFVAELPRTGSGKIDRRALRNVEPSTV